MDANPHILVLQGSPRKKGNTAALVSAFVEGANEAGVAADVLHAADLSIKPCTGCLRCNVLGRCVLKDDDWPSVADRFKSASGVLFATPVYFFHMSGTLKLVIDRFRSLIHVQVIADGDGLIHSARFPAEKEYGLLCVLGGLANYGCDSLKDIFNFMASHLSHMREREVETLICRGLPMAGQVTKSAEDLEKLYERLGVPGKNPQKDFLYNQSCLDKARQMGRRMAKRVLEQGGDEGGADDSA